MNQHTGNHTIRIRHRHRSKVWLSGLRMETKNLHHIIVHHGITYRKPKSNHTEKALQRLGKLPSDRNYNANLPLPPLCPSGEDGHEPSILSLYKSAWYHVPHLRIQLQLIHMAIIEPKRTSKRIGETPQWNHTKTTGL